LGCAIKPRAAASAACGLTYILIRVYLRLSRSNVRFPGVSRTINHQELAAVIGTGFICGFILVSLGVLGVLAAD
jgi:hypothetical protein